MPEAMVRLSGLKMIGISNVCVVTRRKMQIHMEKARDHGYLDVDCPSVEYDYRDYVKQ